MNNLEVLSTSTHPCTCVREIVVFVSVQGKFSMGRLSGSVVFLSSEECQLA